MFVPTGLVDSVTEWWAADGHAWLARLPALIADVEERWAVTVGRAFEPGGCTAFVAPAARADGTAAVVKLAYPHREVDHEAEALTVLGGDGCVRLLASAPEHHALLLERCRPGTALGDLADENEIISEATALLRRLWRPVPLGCGIETLEVVAGDSAELVESRWQEFGRPFDEALVRNAIHQLRSLPGNADERVLLHRDFHPWNVLAAEREPWLAIDPKPVVGDPAFDVVQLALHGNPLGDPDAPGTVRARLLKLAGALDLDPERLRLWGVARMVEWALWSIAVGNDTEARAIGEAGLLAKLVLTGHR